ncbi:ribosomal-processing cysteine protease Prp [Ferroacidibacillus organovorans]|uniref:Ribosomal processing cysteine protease Prp n=1 Tax=Ferroacidibacillus organovorans TaxID=1765683 RepID=A0A162TBF7_9BACL|nr:ribosomal-processing cysteine protease Prp [Ferroacidibacillus organovorans]KYP80639.1 hypothetical protein AYJ22_10695 [Ferroacidibacillus organovorans]OAG94325.1 hypothetical protein AYW79_06230 [Ferroacidibacillus organovorans]OPG16434.1 hypothetical protein B2M26_06030 [Ferroacidibacillus organovorans]
MIRVTVTRNENQTIERVVVSGHAGAGPLGFDLVCAGVSTLVVTCVNSIERLTGLHLNEVERDGYVRFDVPQSRDAQLLAEGMLIGVQDMEREYGAHITLRTMGKNK